MRCTRVNCVHNVEQLRADVARMTSPPGENTPPSKSKTFGRAFEDLVRGWNQHELWLQLGWQDIKQRYRRSVIGPFWITIAIPSADSIGAMRERPRSGR